MCREVSDKESYEALEAELGKIDEESRWSAFNSAMINVLAHYYEKIGRWREGLSNRLESKNIITAPQLRNK